MHSVGDSLRLRFSTYTPAGVAANAGAVTLQRVEPSGLVVTSTVGPTTTGVYEAHLTLNQPGLWQWVWQASGGAAVRKVENDAQLVHATSEDQYPDHPWCTLADVLAVPQLATYATAGTLNLELLDRQCAAATEYLHRRTWRRFKGLRAVELRPCCSCAYRFVPGRAVWPWQGSLGSWQMDVSPTIDLPDGLSPCGCGTLPEIQLPRDLQLVTEVRIDGAVFTDWRLDFGRRIVRTDGDLWPCCQQLELADTEDDTFSIRVIVGDRESELARDAAMELAAELYLAIADPSACRIPTRVKRVQTQGATYETAETTTVDGEGKLGLRITDLFLLEYGKKRRRMRIASPDVPEPARRL